MNARKKKREDKLNTGAGHRTHIIVAHLIGKTFVGALKRFSSYEYSELLCIDGQTAQ